MELQPFKGVHTIIQLEMVWLGERYLRYWRPMEASSCATVYDLCGVTHMLKVRALFAQKWRTSVFLYWCTALELQSHRL